MPLAQHTGFLGNVNTLRLSRWIVRLSAGLVMAAAAAGEPSGAAGKIRVLLITGGHAFDRDTFFQVFREAPEFHITHLEHSKGTADAWDRADPGACDVVLLYDMPRTITEPQKAKFLGTFEKGTGLVVTHHALVSFPGWPDYERIIGGRYVSPPDKGGAPGAKPSGYEHDIDIPVTVVKPDHPITRGLGDFVIRDEIYWDFRVGADITPLLTTTHPKSGNPLAWHRTEGRSRVAYILFGHGPSAFGDPNYRRLMANALRWAAAGD